MSHGAAVVIGVARSGIGLCVCGIVGTRGCSVADVNVLAIRRIDNGIGSDSLIGIVNHCMIDITIVIVIATIATIAIIIIIIEGHDTSATRRCADAIVGCAQDQKDGRRNDRSGVPRASAAIILVSIVGAVGVFVSIAVKTTGTLVLFVIIVIVIAIVVIAVALVTAPHKKARFIGQRPRVVNGDGSAITGVAVRESRRDIDAMVSASVDASCDNAGPAFDTIVAIIIVVIAISIRAVGVIDFNDPKAAAVSAVSTIDEIITVIIVTVITVITVIVVVAIVVVVVAVIVRAVDTIIKGVIVAVAAQCQPRVGHRGARRGHVSALVWRWRPVLLMLTMNVVGHAFSPVLCRALSQSR